MQKIRIRNTEGHGNLTGGHVLRKAGGDAQKTEGTSHDKKEVVTIFLITETSRHSLRSNTEHNRNFEQAI